MIKTIITFLTALSILILPGILVAWLLSLSFRTHFGGISVISPKRLIAAITIPMIVGFRELSKKSLTMSGVIAAMFVGFVQSVASGCFIISSLVFFISSSKLTRFRASKKAKLDEEASTGSMRNWLNVFNNGAVPTALSFLYIIEVGCRETIVDFQDPYRYISSWLSIAILGSIACACGDTWASEIGPAFGKSTSTLISTGSTVPAGTNGGVTIIGTLASIAGGLLVGFSFSLSSFFFISSTRFQWSVVLIGGVAGFIGSTIDSLLGATLQYSGFDEIQKKVVGKPGPDVKHISGVNFLNNHAVNFISCCITSLLSPVLYQAGMALTNELR